MTAKPGRSKPGAGRPREFEGFLTVAETQKPLYRAGYRAGRTDGMLIGWCQIAALVAAGFIGAWIF